MHEPDGRGGEADGAHGGPPGRVRGPQHPAREADRGAQGGDQNLSEVRGKTQTHREPGVCQERHHEVSDPIRNPGEVKTSSRASDHPQAKERGGFTNRRIY